MNIEIKKNENGFYDLLVDGHKKMVDESMGVCSEVKRRLQLKACGTSEFDEVAEAILKDRDLI